MVSQKSSRNSQLICFVIFVSGKLPNLLDTRCEYHRADFFSARKVLMSVLPTCCVCHDTHLVVCPVSSSPVCFECFIKLFFSQYFSQFNNEQKTNFLKSLRSMLEILDMEYKESINLKERKNI
jgi:hypothetical protein